MSRLRRGHRLHSISALDEVVRFVREESSHGPSSTGRGTTTEEDDTKLEEDFIEAVRCADFETLERMAADPVKVVTLSRNCNFVKKVAKEVVVAANSHVIKVVLGVFTDTNPKSFEVGEVFALEALESGRSDLVVCVLEFWRDLNKGVDVGISCGLDVIHNSVYFAANKRLREDSKTLYLVELSIYSSTVDSDAENLKAALRWHEDNADVIGQSVKLNADCMLHAALEEDREMLAILYSFGYRLGTDTDRRINKDYLKRIKLFRARASPVYKSVVFENSLDINQDDPLKKCFEYARQARIYADTIQDFNREYSAIAKKCEEFAEGMLDRCTTKHEVQTLLQTKMDSGHMDANFNIAILDGHKEFVAHEKFQQMLHKKWGQRDRAAEGSVIRGYNIFWSEKTMVAKVCHAILQFLLFFLLPFIYIPSAASNTVANPKDLIVETSIGAKGCSSWCTLLNWLRLQMEIPVNRFLHWEFSKVLFYVIILMTLTEEKDIDVWDFLAMAWIVSYLLENLRTIHRLYRFSKKRDNKRIFKRWLTFRNLYILATDLIFFTSLILRSVAYLNNQCRRGCPYEGNEVAFVASAIWSAAALLAFLRSFQSGLMWRTTGPVIISITYMTYDVIIFLFLFFIVYLSFTVATVYVYDVYSDARTSHFNSHKRAFKLFFWAMIRTGNPHFADIRVHNATKAYNASCLGDLTAVGGEIPYSDVNACGKGLHSEEIEEGIPYIAGNTLWAVYQFIVVIVLLSILRARMVNTYHRIFKEADVQWKFFRASMWWKYLDRDTMLPPPFTVLYFFHCFLRWIAVNINNACCAKQRRKCDKNPSSAGNEMRQEEAGKLENTEDKAEADRREFERRYRNLMLMLISNSAGGSANKYYAHPTSISRNSSVPNRAMDID